MPGGLVRAGHGHRLVTGRDAGAGRGREVVGRAGVPGQLGRRTADAALLEGLGVGRVQPHPLARQQVVVDGLGQQGVPERVAVAAHRHQHVALDGRPQRHVEGADLAVEDPVEQQVGHPAAGHRRGPDDVPGVVVELVQAHQQQVGQSPRRSRPAPTSAAPTSSSVKNALPSARSTMPRSVALGQRTAVQRPDQGADVVVGAAGRASTRLTPGSRDHSAAVARNGCRRCRSSLR